MLDVHPPHSAIHGKGEFFLHLFTITIGLLIAVGIEGAVTRHEHRKLADEAHETMTAEIRQNATNATDALREIDAIRAKMNQNIAEIARIQANPSGADADLDIGYGVTDFKHTAWRTAQATGALTYMPYEQAERFSGIYEAADTLEKDESMSTEDTAQFLGLVRRYRIGKGHMSKEAADAMAERLGIWQGHLLTIHLAARYLQEQQNAYLEGREVTHHLSEKIEH